MLPVLLSRLLGITFFQAASAVPVNYGLLPRKPPRKGSTGDDDAYANINGGGAAAARTARVEPLPVE